VNRGRLEAFSDGVIAVATTLLALNLAVAYLISFFIVERTPAVGQPTRQ
jgi:uncharacterized membrane protein